MREFVSQKKGNRYSTTKNKYWLESCPVCNSELLWNGYNDKEVSSLVMKKSISFDIKIEYCEKCDDYYVCIE